MNEFPEDWTVKKLESLCEKIVDGSHFTPTYMPHGIPFLRVTDIQTQHIDFNSIKYISKEEHDEFCRRVKPRKGDILFSKNGTIGLLKVVDWDWEFSIFVSLALIRVKDFSSITLDYLCHCLTSNFLKEQIKNRSKQGTVTNLHLEEIREFEILLPPIEEQKKISEILSTSSRLIELATTEIKKLKDLKKAMLQEILTQGLGHKTFKESEFGSIPEGWDIKTLGQMGVWKGGGTPSKSNPEFWDNGVIPWVTPKDMKSDYIVDSQDKITQIALQKSKAQIFPPDSIAFVARSGILKHTLPVSIAKVPFTVNQDLKVLIVDKIHNPHFVYYFIKAFEDQIRIKTVKTGTIVESLETDLLFGINLPVPPRSEQDQIVNLFSTLTSKIEKKSMMLQKFILLKQGLMNDLLTGRVSVKKLIRK